RAAPAHRPRPCPYASRPGKARSRLLSASFCGLPFSSWPRKEDTSGSALRLGFADSRKQFQPILIGRVSLPATTNSRPVITPVVVVVVLIAALAILVRLVEPHFAFFPSAGATPPPTEPGIQITSWSVATADGERLQGWSLEPAAPRAVALYFHGNGGN